MSSTCGARGCACKGCDGNAATSSAQAAAANSVKTAIANQSIRSSKLRRSEVAPNAAKFRDALVPRGYALLVMDVRGTGASFGHHCPSATAVYAPASPTCDSRS